VGYCGLLVFIAPVRMRDYHLYWWYYSGGSQVFRYSPTHCSALMAAPGSHDAISGAPESSSHSFVFFWLHFLSLYICIYVCMLLPNFCKLCIFVMFMYSYCYACCVLCFLFQCCSVYCLCVNVFCTSATGCQANCS